MFAIDITLEKSVVSLINIVRFLQAASSMLKIRRKGATLKFLIFYLNFLFG